MALFDKTLFHISMLNWTVALGLAAVTFFALFLLKRLAARKLGAFAATTETKLDDLAVNLIGETKSVTLLTVALFIGSLSLSLPEKAQMIVQKVLVLTLLIQGALWSNHLVSFWFEHILDRRIEKGSANASTRSVLNFAARLVLWTIALLLVLDNLGFNVTTLVAGLGVGGIAIALAVQNILADLFASLSIILDKPFVVGDFVIVDDYLGTVKQIGLKTTRIQSLSGEEVVFSNTDLLRSRIRNYKRMYERRVAFTIGITYDTTFEKLAFVKMALRQIIESQKEVRFDRAHFKEYGDSALIYEAVYYVLNPDYNRFMDIQENINTELFRQFAANGIDFAYPTRTVVLRQDTAAIVRDPRGRTE